VLHEDQSDQIIYYPFLFIRKIKSNKHWVVEKCRCHPTAAILPNAGYYHPCLILYTGSFCHLPLCADPGRVGKNLELSRVGLVIGATVRGGKMEADLEKPVGEV